VKVRLHKQLIQKLGVEVCSIVVEGQEDPEVSTINQYKVQHDRAYAQDGEDVAGNPRQILKYRYQYRQD
jgi:hypothetical protein